MGRDAVFAEIAERLVRRGDERAVCSWYAAHPMSGIAVISTPSNDRIAGRRFPSLDATGNIRVSIRISRSGMELNTSLNTEPVRAAVSQVALLSALTKRPVRLHITCTNVQILEELLVLLQDASHGLLLVEVELLQTTEFSALLGRHRRRTGRVLEALRTVEHLILEGSRDVDAKLAGIHELERLKRLDIAGMQLCSLAPLRGMHTLSDIDVSVTAITDVDIHILGQLPHLRRIIVDSCAGLKSLDPLGRHPSLRCVSAVRCVHLRLVRALTTISTLDYVDLSYTAVRPEDLARCVEGLGSVRSLALSGLRLAEVRGWAGACWQWRRLSLMEVCAAGFGWIVAAPYLRHLVLNGTEVTEKQLVGICASLPHLELLSVSRCLFLRTSLSFALDMEYMHAVLISRHSLAESNAIALLKERGVVCEVD
ncbi:putative leucine-rich repeat protein (LRRP) [Trypanosoma grayi]|uniref:putative leucine-rich repeat protein (LRRP) n=1 Tax=Trypanosoma grayi TaxID=71804 RepID=UPI0004F4B968|nr:putative leucine-rich repeat protein (LRRP) [Trypanosoma grayi]KEG10331.1 putative leucine-rich repeat protein (LRRP) [Trypanosoma grayi]